MKAADNAVAFKKALEKCFERFSRLVEQWHVDPAGQLVTPCAGDTASLSVLECLVTAEHLTNFKLWHVEDQARRTDVDDSVIADCKRRIDLLNQQRNDEIEAVDRCVVELLEPFLPLEANYIYNTESIGSALDRLSILSLKIYHMDEQTKRQEVSQEHIQKCLDKLVILQEQSRNLRQAVLALTDEYAAGKKRPKVYRQFKMYNDPDLNPAVYANR